MNMNITWQEIEDPTPYIGTRMNWSTIQEKFPDRWIALRDVDFEDQYSTFTSGVLVAVCKDFEVSKISEHLRNENLNDGVYWQRSTELEGNVLWIE